MREGSSKVKAEALKNLLHCLENTRSTIVFVTHEHGAGR